MRFDDGYRSYERPLWREIGDLALGALVMIGFVAYSLIIAGVVMFILSTLYHLLGG